MLKISPINAPPDSSSKEILDAISELKESLKDLIDSGGNLDFSKQLDIDLDGTEKELIPPNSGAKQEAWILNSGSTSIMLYISLGEGFLIPVELAPGQSWNGAVDSSSSISAVGIGSLKLLIKSNQYISIGDEEMPVEVKVKLLVGTGANFDNPFADFYDSEANSFEQNLNKFLNSDEGLSGWKLVAIDQFQPGLELSFDVVVAGSNNYDLTAPISFQWISVPKIIQLLATVASDVINPEIEEVSPNISGLLTKGGWAGNVETNKIKLQPTMTSYIGRFAAKSLTTGAYDTCIISGYAKNQNNPYQGGTFTLQGF